MVPKRLHLLTMAAADDDGHVNAYAKIAERSLDAIKMMIVLMNCDLVPNEALDSVPNVCNLQRRWMQKRITQTKSKSWIASNPQYTARFLFNFHNRTADANDFSHRIYFLIGHVPYCGFDWIMFFAYQSPAEFGTQRWNAYLTANNSRWPFSSTIRMWKISSTPNRWRAASNTAQIPMNRLPACWPNGDVIEVLMSVAMVAPTVEYLYGSECCARNATICNSILSF